MLEEIIGFEVPLHERQTKLYGRPIIDFPKFAALYREKYPSVGKIYTDIEKRFGRSVVDLLLELT